MGKLEARGFAPPPKIGLKIGTTEDRVLIRVETEFEGEPLTIQMAYPHEEAASISTALMAAAAKVAGPKKEKRIFVPGGAMSKRARRRR